MKISMDKKYRTRDGRDVRLLCVDGDAKQPVVGIVNGRVGQWDNDGSWISKNVTNNDDLIEYHEPDIRTIWVNVYEGWTVSYDSEEAAKASAIDRAISIAQPVTFEVKK